MTRSGNGPSPTGRITYASIGMVEGIPQSSSWTPAISDFSLDAAGAIVAGSSTTNATAAKKRVTNRHIPTYNAPTSNLVRCRAGRARLPPWIDKLPIGCDRVDPPEFRPTRQCWISALFRQALMCQRCGRSAGRYAKVAISLCNFGDQELLSANAIEGKAGSSSGFAEEGPTSDLNAYR